MFVVLLINPNNNLVLSDIEIEDRDLQSLFYEKVYPEGEVDTIEKVYYGNRVYYEKSPSGNDLIYLDLDLVASFVEEYLMDNEKSDTFISTYNDQTKNFQCVLFQG